MTNAKTVANVGETAANTLVAAINAGNLPPNVTLVHTCGQLPAAFATLAQTIQQNHGTSVFDLLYAAVRPHITLRPSFTMATAVATKDQPEQQSRFRDMANGSGQYAFDLAGLQIEAFVTSMFTGIVAGHHATAFTERDLFHGHFVPNEANRDVVVVFHAKEYPVDMLNSFQIQRFQRLNLETPNMFVFDADNPAMYERNFIWTLRTNKIYLVTGAPKSPSPASTFRDLMCLKGVFPTEPIQVKCGTMWEQNFGDELFSVNYFPTLLASQPLFFCPVGQWGVLVSLEAQFPNIQPAIIAQTYQAQNYSLAETTKVLRTM